VVPVERHSRTLLGEALDSAGATAIGRRFQLALAWLATGALVGALEMGHNEGHP